MSGDLLLRSVRVAGPGRELLPTDEPVDILIRAGLIADIAPAGNLRGAVEEIDGDGMWVVSGLWDHHVHTVQWALNAQRVQLGVATSPSEAARLDGGCRGAARRAGGRRGLPGRAVERTSLAGAAGRDDGGAPHVPHQCRRAQRVAELRGPAPGGFDGVDDDGMLREEDAFEISRRLNATDDATVDAAIRTAAERAAARGITGLVDFDMAWTADAWRRRAAAGFDTHRVEFAFYPAGLQRAIDEGLRSGEELDGTQGLVHVGPLKLITDGSLGTRTAACSQPYPGDPADFGVLTIPPDELRELLTRATVAGLDVAVHAIGDRAVASALDAFTYTQARGTIEHAQLVRHADLARFARLGVVASVQPAHALDDRDLVEDLWRHQRAISYPLATLLTAGISVRFGSDAPVAPLDPWGTIAAAVHRTDDERAPWHPEERVSIDQALRASSRHGEGSIGLGAVADLVLCGADPRAVGREELRRMPIAATILGGRVTFRG